MRTSIPCLRPYAWATRSAYSFSQPYSLSGWAGYASSSVSSGSRHHVPIHADRRREEVPWNGSQRGCVGHVQVDQGVVAHDLALGGVNETHAAHVCGQVVDLVEPVARQRYGLPAARLVA